MEKFELDQNDPLTHLSHFKTRCYQCQKLINGTSHYEFDKGWTVCFDCGVTMPIKNTMVWH